MADRGRDLKISILSDTSKFDLDGPAKELDTLGEASTHAAADVQDTTDELKRLAAQGKDAQKELDRLNAEAKDSRFDQYGKDAKEAAKKVDRAFDDIAKSAKTSMKKVAHEADEGFHDVGHATAEVKDEAKANLSEVTSSFQGDMTSAVDVIQGTLGGLVANLGPAGAAIAAAGALAVGTVAKLFSDSTAKAEESKQAVQDLYAALVEGAGKLSEASLVGRVQDLLGDPDKFRDLSKQAHAAGISVATYARALSGSVPDQAKVNDQLVAQSKAMATAAGSTGKSTGALVTQQKALETVADRLGIARKETGDATTAWKVLHDATAAGITADVTVRAPTAKELANERAELQRGVGKPVSVPVTVVGATRAAQLANAQIQDYMRRHPVSAPVSVTAPGHTRDVQ